MSSVPELAPGEVTGKLTLSQSALAAVALTVVAFVATGVLLWSGRFTGATLLLGALVVVFSLLPALPGMRGLAPLSAALVAVSAAQIVPLALPLPLLTPGSRLALQGAGAWLVLLAVQWAGPAELRWRRRGRAPGTAGPLRRVLGRPDQLLTGIACGAVAGGIVSVILPVYPQTQPPTTLGVVTEALAVTLMVAVPEELLWRGLLSPRLWESVGPLAVVIEGVLYASSYGDSQRLALLALVFVAGAVASILRRVSGSVRAPLVGHCVTVLLALVVLPRL